MVSFNTVVLRYIIDGPHPCGQKISDNVGCHNYTIPNSVTGYFFAKFVCFSD